MFIISIGLFSFGLMTLVVLVLLIAIKPKIINSIPQTNFPFVSILIATRNEERKLPFLFASLKKLDYPTEKFEILFGDDMSEDVSAELIKEFCLETSNSFYNRIEPSKKQIAKANVLMQLAEKSKGEYLYFLDADMMPNPSILKEYVSRMSNKLVGITGITLPIGDNLLESWQKIDWMVGLGIVTMTERFGQETTAMGNNMFLRKTVYDELGGYGSLPISTVEDFTLYKAIVSKGYSFPLQFTSQLLTFTHPMKTFKGLFHQRKRWMQGGTQVSLFLQAVLISQYLFYPLILILCFFNLNVSLSLWGLKIVVQFIYHSVLLKRIGQKMRFLALLSYEIYNTIFICMLLLFYLLPIKMDWKGRKF